MKKFILLQLLFQISISLTCVAQEDRPKPNIKIKIASPRKDCDSGLNFCTTLEYTFRQVNAGITIKENQIQFHLERNTMHETLENELLHAHQFPIEEGTILPMDICMKIGLREETTLKQGYYPIQISDEYFTINCVIE